MPARGLGSGGPRATVRRPIGSARRARRCTCSTASSRRRGCTSSAAIPAFPTSIPTSHRLVIHGLVKRPLVFTLEALSRYPMKSRIAFIECAGNSQALNAPQAGAARHGRDPRPARLPGMDRREALDAARRGRRRSVGALGDRRGRRLLRHEPQHPARQGDGRRARLPLPERRAGAAFERLSGAAAGARLRRQHERQMAAPAQADRRAGA